MVGIGIIGAGRICAAHATAALALPETELIAISDVDEARLSQATGKYGGKGYPDYHAMLAESRVDAVVIGLPHGLHRDVMFVCLWAGLLVLLVLSMAMNVAECDAMIAAAEASGKTLMVAHSQHFFPVNVAARQLIADGGIGNLVLATDTWYKSFYDTGTRPAWFLDDSKGGGMWSMNGSHMIDRLLFLLQRRVVAVKAKIGNPVYGLSTDMGIAYLDFEGGLGATLAHCGYREGVNQFQAEITGTEGQIKIDGDRMGGTEFWISRNGKWASQAVPPPATETRNGTQEVSPFTLEVREFARSLIEGRPPSITAEYGREVVRVMTACEESSRTGREVRLD